MVESLFSSVRVGETSVGDGWGEVGSEWILWFEVWVWTLEIYIYIYVCVFVYMPH